MPKKSRARRLWAIALLAIFGASLALAERLPMAPRGPKVNVKTAEFSVETNSAGDWVMRYTSYEAGRPVVVVHAPPNKVEAIVSAEVERDQIGNFIYSYQLANLPASKQKVRTFVLEFAGQVTGLRAPKRWEAYELEWMKAVVWKPYIAGQDPDLGPGHHLEGFELSVPLHIVTGDIADSAIGSQAAGFHYEGAMPGIVDCHARGANEIMTFPDEPPDMDDVLPRFPFDGVSGRTIGPVAMPAEIQFSWILERLRADLEESLGLRWIADRATLDRYLKLLARFAASMGEPWLKSLEKLQSIASQAEADFEQGNLTTEAYALLKHTSQLLELFLKKT